MRKEFDIIATLGSRFQRREGNDRAANTTAATWERDATTSALTGRRSRRMCSTRTSSAHRTPTANSRRCHDEIGSHYSCQSRCGYCGRYGLIVRAVGARRRIYATQGERVVCQTCTNVAHLAHHLPGDRIRNIIYEHLDPVRRALTDQKTRRRLLALWGRWRRHCEFCGRTERNDGMVLRGDSTACIRCIVSLYNDMNRRPGLVEGLRGVELVDYGLVSDVYEGSRASLVDDGYYAETRRTFLRTLRDGTTIVHSHGLEGLRVSCRVAAGSYLPSWSREEIHAEPPPSMASYELAAPCWFCGQTRSRVQLLGLGKRTGAVICYECVALAYDAFRADGSIMLRGERPAHRSPVHWAYDAPPRSHILRPEKCARLAPL